jgi:hypothetical protein
VITEQVVKPYLGRTSDVEIVGANVAIKFKLGVVPRTVLIINMKTGAEIRMRHSRTIHACIIETDHGQLDVELPPLPTGLVAELLGTAGAPATGVLGVR